MLRQDGLMLHQHGLMLAQDGPMLAQDGPNLDHKNGRKPEENQRFRLSDLKKIYVFRLGPEIALCWPKMAAEMA